MDEEINLNVASLTLLSASTECPTSKETELNVEITPASEYIKSKGKSVDQSMFYCHLCPSGTGLFMGQENLIHHFQATCKTCGKTFHQFEHFQTHMVSVHQQITSGQIQKLVKWSTAFIEEISKLPKQSQAQITDPKEASNVSASVGGQEGTKVNNAKCSRVAASLRDRKQDSNVSKLGGWQGGSKEDRRHQDTKAAAPSGPKIGQWIIWLNGSKEIKIGMKPASSNVKFYCEVCSISLTSQKVFDEHTQGKNHKKKLNQSAVSFQKEEVEGPKKFRCDHCDLNVHSEEVLNTHLKGKNHRKKLIQSEADSKPVVQSEPQKVLKHKPDKAGNNSDLWKDVFTKNLSDVFSRKLDMNSKHLDRDGRGPLNMDSSLKADFVCKTRLPGKKDICGRKWSSFSVTVTFFCKIDLAKNQGEIYIKEYNQRCKRCSSYTTFSKPTLDYDRADQAAEKLKQKILEKFYGQTVQKKQDQDSKEDWVERHKPHDRANCEACIKGAACASSKREKSYARSNGECVQNKRDQEKWQQTLYGTVW